jgi:nucleotide-binding universal stress UspA family protein
MFSRTLVCLDGSKLAEQVLPFIFQSCQRNKDEIILLQVITSNITIPPLESIHIPPFIKKVEAGPVPVSDIGETETKEPEVGSQLAEVAREEFEAKRYLEGIAEPLRQKGFKVSTSALQGDPAKTLLRYADKHKVSLIALTTHGKGGMKRGALGRIAQLILKSWGNPVLLIKPKV